MDGTFSCITGSSFNIFLNHVIHVNNKQGWHPIMAVPALEIELEVESTLPYLYLVKSES